MNSDTYRYRAATGADQAAIIALLDGVYAEYGDRVCLEGSEADLTDIPGNYAEGSFMVLEKDGAILGTVAVAPCDADPQVCWLKRMYLSPALRGSGWGARMIEWAKDQTRASDRKHLHLWSDVRFERGHAFYRKMGFSDTGETRKMDDSFDPYEEYFFALELE